MPDALDGNAVAGALHHVFGSEMTAAIVACAHCGAVWRVANLRVYVRAPGTVVRCAGCAGVMMVLVDRRGTACVDVRGTVWSGQP
jgi:hypothetical protein